MSCHVMSCHVMSCHVMSCHVMSLSCIYVIRRCLLLASLVFEDPLAHELEGQLALLEGHLCSKEQQLRELQVAVSEEQGSRKRFLAVLKGRRPQELMSELEALQAQKAFLQDLVSRFEERRSKSWVFRAIEDKTMMMEKQLKSLGTSKQDMKSLLKPRCVLTFCGLGQELEEELARCRSEHLEAKARGKCFSKALNLKC